MILKNLNITPTMKCNLKCKLCGILVPHYDYHPQMTVEEFENSLEEIFKIVDKVKKLQITGGEPLMYPNLPVLIEKSFLYNKYFDELWLLTNGTIPFNQELRDILIKYKEKVFVHCSDYGIKKDVTKDIIEFLKTYGIRHRYLKYYDEEQYCNGWVDNGDFLQHNRTKEDNEKVFANCEHVRWGGNWYLRNGQLHWCGRSLRGTEVGKIPLIESDYLDLFDASTTVEDKKKKMDELLKVKSITACDFCKGHYGTKLLENRYPAGEQCKN